MSHNTTYNGWTNYATWRVNLEIFDTIDPEFFDLESGETLKCTDVHELANAMKEHAETLICDYKNESSLVQDYALAFLSEVNWHEIANYFIETYAD